MEVLRRIRGLLGVGLTWGALWGVIGGVIGAIIGIVAPEAAIFGDPIIEWALGMGAYGVISGVGFGALLSLGEASRTLREISLKRVAMWGVLGSAAVPLIFGAAGFFEVGTTLADVLGAMLVTAGLGGVSAPTAVAIARKAELEAGDEYHLLE